MVINATGVLRVGVEVNGAPSLFFGKKFFDFPVILLDANGKFEIFLGDRIPIL